MSFESEHLSWLIPGLAVLLTLSFALDHARRRRLLATLGSAGIGSTGMVELMANALSTRRRALRATLLVLALVLCMTALAGPTVPGASTWRQRGIDIVFVHDYSKSMMATDVYPNRLDRSLKEAEILLSKLSADRVATVVYAGGATHFPLTHDHVAARMVFQGLRPSDLAPGSDQGQALRMATCILAPEAAELGHCALLAPGKGGDPLEGEPARAHAEAPRVDTRARALVLFSDGEDSEGQAAKEAALAKSLGIELYVVGVGTAAGELLPTLDDEGQPSGFVVDKQGAFVTTRLELGSLQSIVEAGQGQFFSLGEGRWRGEALADDLKKLRRGDLDTRVVQSRRHIYQRFLFPAFLLLLLEACLSQRKRGAGLPRKGGIHE